ncbi:MAG: acyl carrier protein [Myxococcales bacterium]|nr:acyl carrier protein [Myxococcales bacterium]
MRSAVFRLVGNAISELNEELGYQELDKISEDTRLLGGDAGLDSLSLVALIVAIEEDVQEAFGRPVTLADERAMSRKNSPYRSVGALVDFIVELLEGCRA